MSKKKTYMAMEVMKMSLHDLAYDERYQLTESDIKCIAFELLTGLEFLHRNSVMHRVMMNHISYSYSKIMLRI